MVNQYFFSKKYKFCFLSKPTILLKAFIYTQIYLWNLASGIFNALNAYQICEKETKFSFELLIASKNVIDSSLWMVIFIIKKRIKLPYFQINKFKWQIILLNNFFFNEIIEKLFLEVAKDSFRLENIFDFPKIAIT